MWPVAPPPPMDHIEDDEDENIPDERDPEVVLRLDSSEASAECPKISELRREDMLGAADIMSLRVNAL
jgi:hypothetical protein